MTQQLVDPDGYLVAEGCRYGMLAMGAGRDRHLGTTLGEVGHRQQRFADQANDNCVRLAQKQEITGLRDVLRRCTPVHPAAMGITDHARQLPNKRHKSVAGARKARIDARAIQQLKPCSSRDGCRRLGWNDRELCLRPRQRHFDVEPGLPAALLRVDGPNARVRYARGGWKRIAHEASPVSQGGCVGVQRPWLRRASAFQSKPIPWPGRSGAVAHPSVSSMGWLM